MSLHSFNLSKPFPPCPASSNQALPFAIDEMDFAVWLTALGNADDMTKCQKILQVLQTLNENYPPERSLIPGRTRLFFLEKLGAALTTATTMLTLFPSIPDTSSHSSAANDMARSEISAWSTLELANAYSLLSQEDWFKKDDYYSTQEKTLILSNGIQAMGRGLLYIYQTYTKPYVYFWHKCFQFYRLAQLYRLTDGEFNPNALIIDNAFKRVLVFSLSNTNQFSPSEMRMIYDLLGHYASYTSLLKSVPKKKFKGIPSIHLKGNGPPVVSGDDDNLDPDRLYIATVTVASKILEATNDRRTHYAPTDRLMLLRLAKTLMLSEQRKDPRESAQSEFLGIMGLDNIVQFLQSKKPEKPNIGIPVGSYDSSRPGELRDLDFEISNTGSKAIDANEKAAPIKATPVAFQLVEFTDASDIWRSGQQNNKAFNMRLVDKSAKGFGLLWTDTLVKPKVGSIVGILNKTMTVGMIRWLAQSKETGMFMGVELLGRSATTVKITNPGYPDDEVSAIYLAGDELTNQSESLIFINKGFQPSEFVFLNKNHKNIRYRLTKQLHITSFINHVEIIRSH
jgi:hypothetical protein